MSFTIEKSDKGYLLFTITRNEKRNAINYDVMDGLVEAVSRAKENDIKALVITGEGHSAFCSGGDLSVFHLLQTEAEAYSMLSKMANILYSLLTMTKPTIALMNGTAIGGGCELAASCDFRLARQGIKAGFVQGKQAITTGWGGGSILAEKFSAPIAMKLLMDADIHTADYLHTIGFFDELFENGEPINACEAYLEKILSVDVTVLEAYKLMMVRKWEESKLRERIEKEVRLCSILWESEAHHEYVQRFIQKKTHNQE